MTPKRNRQLARLGKELTALVLDGQLPKYTLGIELDVQADGRVKVLKVVPGGAAERDGLRGGDILLKAADRELAGEPTTVLGQILQRGDVILIEFERDGNKMTAKVKPNPR